MSDVELFDGSWDYRKMYYTLLDSNKRVYKSINIELEKLREMAKE